MFENKINQKMALSSLSVLLMGMCISSSSGAPAWPVYLGAPIHYPSPLIVDLNKDGVDEVLIGTTAGTMSALRENGSTYWSFQTQGSIASSAASADIDRDGFPEIIFYAKDGYIYVLNHDGTPLEAQGYEWPYYLGAISEQTSMLPGVALGDLDNDLFLEIVAGTRDGNGGLVALNHTGSVLWQTAIANSNGRLYNTPAIGDIDADGYADVVINYGGDAMGIPRGHVGVFDGENGNRFIEIGMGLGTPPSSPAISDINNDGYLEIVSLTADNIPGYIFVLDHTGEILWTDFITNPDDPDHDWIGPASPALGNIDDEANLEILVDLVWNMRAWDEDGERLWRNPNEGTGYSSPVLYDVNRNNKVESFVGSFSYTDQVEALSGYDHNGNELADFPYLGETRTGVYSSPSLGDLDKDGRLDIVIGMPDGYLYRWDTDFPYNRRHAIWETFHADARRSGLYGSPRLSELEDITMEVSEKIAFVVIATDFDDRETELSYFAEDLPEGATFERRLRVQLNSSKEPIEVNLSVHNREPIISPYRFRWTPNIRQVGEYLITFIVKDRKGGFDSQTIKIDVNPMDELN